jgi:hypothetical protein
MLVNNICCLPLCVAPPYAVPVLLPVPVLQWTQVAQSAAQPQTGWAPARWPGAQGCSSGTGSSGSSSSSSFSHACSDAHHVLQRHRQQTHLRLFSTARPPGPMPMQVEGAPTLVVLAKNMQAHFLSQDS